MNPKKVGQPFLAVLRSYPLCESQRTLCLCVIFFLKC